MSKTKDFIIKDRVLTEYRGDDREVIVPDGVVVIDSEYFGDGVFQDREDLERVVLPEGLKQLGSKSFSHCYNLRSVVLPASLEKIGDNVFANCLSLREIVLPNGVVNLRRSAFEYCTSLERITLPERLASIGDNVFHGCGSLREIRIPQTLEEIGRDAFSESGLVSVTVPDSVRYLGMGAFSNCADLQEIVFPDGLERLPQNLLSGCRSLRSVRFPAQLEAIDTSCFSGCETLEQVSLPAGLRQIGFAAFQRCSALKELTLPDDLTRLGKQAFASCFTLKRVSLPAGLQQVEEYAFHNCGAVEFSSPSPEVLRLLHEKDFEIKNGVLEHYQGPGGDVVLPEEVRALGGFSFSHCTGLQSVTFHANVRAIEAGAFRFCGEVELIGLDPALREKLEADTFEIKNGVLTGYNGTGGDVIIPEGVTSISCNVFWGGSQVLTSVRIPEGVTSIGDSAFFGCRGLRSVTLPDSLRSIGKSAFSGCESLREIRLPEGLEQLASDAFCGCSALADAEGLVILNEILFDEIGDAESVTVPSGVRIIAERAFHSKTRLREITLPDSLEEIEALAFYDSGLERVVVPAGVTKVGEGAFQCCDRLREAIVLGGVETLNNTFSRCRVLERVTLPAALKKINGEAYSGAFRDCRRLSRIDMNGCSAQLVSGCFGELLPKGLLPQLQELLGSMADGAVKQYVLQPKIWNALDDAVRTEIFLTKQSKSLQGAYAKCVKPAQLPALGEAILQRVQSAKPSSKDCTAAAAYMTLFYEKAPDALLRSLYAAMQGKKPAARALKTVEEHVALMEKLGASVEADEDLPPLEKKVSELLIAEKRSRKDLESALKDFYSLTFKDLPPLKAADGHAAEPYALAWLLMAHERLQKHNWGPADVEAAYEQPGLRPEAAEVAALADPASLQKALQALAKDNLGIVGRSKKMFLAFPICRYADESLMAELTARAPKWRSSVSGNDAPPLESFRSANLWSDTRAAMLFAERYRELDSYARIRGVTADELRDQNLSDVGLDEHGGKAYDLGNQTVTARLQRDMSFLFELPNGKTAKSLPKKGADEAKYAAAKVDFDEMRKSVKKILKSRGAVLFLDFLSGRKRGSDEWQAGYLKNPLLRMAGGQIVWAQGKKTFTLTDDGAVDSALAAYAITDQPIRVAHPMEMQTADVTAWQKYFAAHGLKQPFAQVWEPVIDPAAIREDRYAGSVQPMYRFTGKDKHGIHGGNLSAFSEDIGFELDECELEYEASTWRVNWDASDAYYTLGKFTFRKYTRRVNHIVSLLDKWTVEDRVRKDDVSVVDLLDAFTLAQVTEFIASAQEAGASNVLAALLEYQNTRFGDFDPMDEFTLEW